MSPEHAIIRVRVTRSHYSHQCAHCRGSIAPGAFLVVVIYQTVGMVWYCLPCAVALGVPRRQVQAAEG